MAKKRQVMPSCFPSPAIKETSAAIPTKTPVPEISPAATPACRETPPPIKFFLPSSEKEFYGLEEDFTVPTASPERPGFYRFVTRWGSKGTGEGQFMSPTEITVGNENYVYVVDSENHRIQKFDSSGKFVSKWGGCGSGKGEFYWPEGIASDRDGNIYVADFRNDRVQKFDKDGNFIMTYGEGKLDSPSKVEVDSRGNIYVVDSIYKRIQKFDSRGNFITKWRPGDENEKINGITVDLRDSICIVNYFLESRIETFDGSGKVIARWPIKGQEEGKNNYVSGITIDNKGYIYVADLGNNAVKVMRSDGKFFTEFGKKGSGKGEFKKTVDLSVDSEGNVYVVDYLNCNIQKFAPEF